MIGLQLNKQETLNMSITNSSQTSTRVHFFGQLRVISSSYAFLFVVEAKSVISWRDTGPVLPAAVSSHTGVFSAIIKSCKVLFLTYRQWHCSVVIMTAVCTCSIDHCVILYPLPACRVLSLSERLMKTLQWLVHSFASAYDFQLY